MLDHISLRVQDYDRALSFYKAALAPIGYELIMEFPGFAGLGEKGKPDFWITRSEKTPNPTHIAFRCDRARVDAFHAAAVAAGGTDDGPPGVRELYHPNYYGAFVLDPEGNSIEAVSHEGPSTMEKLKAAGSKAVAAIKSATVRKQPKGASGGDKSKAAAPASAAKRPAAGARPKTAGGGEKGLAGGASARKATAGGAEKATASGASARKPTAGGARKSTAGGARKPTAGGAKKPTAGGAKKPTAGGAKKPPPPPKRR